MMTMLRGWITIIVMLTTINAQAACRWPAWEQFKKDYISLQGRVIDPGDARKITTSEGKATRCSLLWRRTIDRHLRNCLPGRKTIWRRDRCVNICPPGCGDKKMPRPGRYWTATPRPMAISGWHGRCWRPVVCGKRRAIPRSERRC
ncbi:endoglucanase [Salmonella enterica subsp. houtenae]|nr:endoglucanase [Salmonella enterica subsp. houtenae]